MTSTTRTLSRRTLATAADVIQFKHPLRPGQLAAYDEAIKYLEEDSKEVRKWLEETRRAGESSGTTEGEASTSNSAAEIERLEVNSLINLPEVRWKFRNGQGELSLELLEREPCDESLQPIIPNPSIASYASSHGEEAAIWPGW